MFVVRQDFVRKHILQKHLEKVDEVKKEVSYFNNYLKVLGELSFIICF